MSKMNEMSQTIEELRKAAAAIADTADWLAKQFNRSTPKPELKPVKPITLEEVRAALAEKSRTGHRAEVKALLQSYGAEKLSEVQPERYENLLTDAKMIGGDDNA